MDESRLSAIKARVSAATPGPWDAVNGSITDWNKGRPPTMEWVPRGAKPVDAAFSDADFIVHAREDVPDLVAEVERLHAMLPAALAQARREGARAMRTAAASAAAWNDGFEGCHVPEALDEVVAALFALPLPGDELAEADR